MRAEGAFAATASAYVPATPLTVAVICVWPATNPLAFPVWSTVATDATVELHTNVPGARSCTPEAVNAEAVS